MVVDDRPFGSVTGYFVSVIADCYVGAVNQQRRRGGVVHIGRVRLILIPRLGGTVPSAIRLVLVIPSGVEGCQVVISVASVVQSVVADIDIVETISPGITQAGVAGEFAIFAPGGRLAARGDAKLEEPMITQLGSGIDPGLGIAIERVQQ